MVLTLGIGVSGGCTMAIRKFVIDKCPLTHSHNDKGTRSVNGKAFIIETVSLSVLEKFIFEF